MSQVNDAFDEQPGAWHQHDLLLRVHGTEWSNVATVLCLDAENGSIALINAAELIACQHFH